MYPNSYFKGKTLILNSNRTGRNNLGIDMFEENMDCLIIDDSELILIFLSDCIQHMGFNPIVAQTAKAGLKLFKKKQPKLIMLDLYLPDGKGLDLLPTFVGEAPFTPVIILSGSDKLDDVIKAFQLGAWDFLTKPITKIEILEYAILKALEKLTLLRENQKYKLDLEKQVKERTEKLQKQTATLEKTNEILNKEIIKRKKAEQELLRLNEKLELRVSDRTQQLLEANQELSNTLKILKDTQNDLVQSEKMASLGNLVAGVSHEINTPLGISITAISYLSQETQKLDTFFKTNEMTKKNLQDFVDNALESTNLISSNLKRASDLIKSFKKIAVDQVTENKRKFKVKAYIEKILLSLRPKLKKTKHKVEILCNEKLEIDNYPGAFAQVITNLVINSILHGYDQNESGTIIFDIREKNKKILLKYSDDGKGIKKDHQPKIFDPFFTTKRNSGGTGLGLHILYNTVVQKLNGTVKCESKIGKGTTFIINIPK